jgi:uncharacterized membrane protein
VIILVFTAIGIVLGVLLPRIHGGPTVPTSRTVEVLGAVGFGILGLVSVIYSLLFLVVQSSNTTFTPRLNLFQDDPWLWRTYAVALGLFAFSMSAFLEIGGASHVTVAVPIFAFVAALAVIGLIRNIQAKAFVSLQMNSTLHSLQRSGRAVINVLYPERLAGPGNSKSPLPAPTGGRPVLWTRPQTTLQQLDLRRLLSAAERSDAVVVFRTRVGNTLWQGATLAEVHGRLEDDVVVASCVTGVNRTFDQDPLLAFRLLADIGLRAVSPAINDPATAVQVIDAIVDLLLLLVSRDLAVAAVRSPTGLTRIHLEVPVWDDFVSEGLDELLVASRNSPMVLARATTALTRLADQSPDDRISEVKTRLRVVQEYFRVGQPEPSHPNGPLTT